MCITTLLKKVLGIKKTIVEGFEVVDGVLVIKVRPSWRKRAVLVVERSGQILIRWGLDAGGI